MIFFWHCGVAFFINTFIIIIVLKYKTLREKEFVYFFILSLSLSLYSAAYFFISMFFSQTMLLIYFNALTFLMRSPSLLQLPVTRNSLYLMVILCPIPPNIILWLVLRNILHKLSRSLICC
jgi:hypothetical protein